MKQFGVGSVKDHPGNTFSMSAAYLMGPMLGGPNRSSMRGPGTSMLLANRIALCLLHFRRWPELERPKMSRCSCQCPLRSTACMRRLPLS